LIEINKEQKKYLIEHNVLKCTNGKIPNLTITSKEKPSKRKKFYVPDWCQKYL